MLSNLINGISLGSVYAIIALGYTMVYGIAKMLNFAHGDVIMVGAYICFFAVSSYGLNPIVGILLAMIVCTALGIIIERLAYKPLRQAPSLAVLITAIGMSYFLQNGAQLLWASSIKTFPSFLKFGGKNGVTIPGPVIVSWQDIVLVLGVLVFIVGIVLFLFGDKIKEKRKKTTKKDQQIDAEGDKNLKIWSYGFLAVGMLSVFFRGFIFEFILEQFDSRGIMVIEDQLLISWTAIVTVVACVIIMIGLTLFTGKTRTGKAMRACSEDKDAARLMGISVNKTISITFAIGSALAAIAGVLLCSAYPNLQPTTGSMPGIKAFTAAVFGGIGSIPGALLGGILLGVIEIFSKAYISTQLSDAIVFAVLIIVLLVKPTGLLGKQIREKV